MPVIRADVAEFHKQLGGEIKFEDLEKILFSIGIEISIEDVTEDVKDAKTGAVTTKVIGKEYLIETAANRPDLTSVELIALTIGTYLGFRKTPQWRIVPNAAGRTKIFVTKNTGAIRPYVVGAIIRDITFTAQSYKSFIDLQEKLHHTFCRRRRLVAIGTHDLDTIKGPFLYDARAPDQIEFLALKQTRSLTARQLLEVYEKDAHMKDFVPIIKDSPVYPIIYDANGVVCSMPPIINGEHSKITLATKNVFVESTATDYQRALQTLNVLVAAFSQYAGEQYTVEDVEIEYEADGRVDVTPKFEKKTFETTLHNIKRSGTINVTADNAADLLRKMQFEVVVSEGDKLTVTVPITRTDILQECDIIEDVCIAYGYNNITPVLPQSQTVGKQQFLNKMSDLLREELAGCGYKEGLNFALNNEDDLIKNLRLQKDDRIVRVGNPRTVEFTCGRTTLIPGMLKWVQHNKNNELPFRLFELGDVVLKADNEVGAKNERRLCAIYSNKNSKLEVIHGLLDQIMAKLNVGLKGKLTGKQKNHYYIAPSDIPTFFPQRQGVIYFNDEPIGAIGVLHPEINQFYDWPYPVSLFEINIESVISKFDNC